MLGLNGQQYLIEQQLTYFGTLEWGLFATNIVVTPSLPAATFTANEVTWLGYTRQNVPTWPFPINIGGSAQTAPPQIITFSNLNVGPGSDTFYGWFLWDPAQLDWVAAVNTGPIVVPHGSAYSFGVAASLITGVP